MRVCRHVHVCRYVHMRAGDTEAMDPHDTDLQEVVSHLMQEPETKLGSPAVATNALNY